MKKIQLAIASTCFLLQLNVFANICGTDFQNFTPLTSGLDFISVHSSETLTPCLGNMGLFLNYSKNTLSYTHDNKTENEDSITGFDLNFGFGLTDNWDFGVSLPVIIGSTVKNADYASFLEANGLTEVRLNTKYRFFGDEKGGFAIASTINFNTMENNPYLGLNAPPTIGIDLIKDSVFGDFALTGNIGYRYRQPGDQVPGVPIFPLRNQWTYSTGVTYYATQLDTKFVFEIKGAQPSEKQLNKYITEKTLESLFGVKREFESDLSAHAGFGTALTKGIASPDFRIYAGFNWTFDNPYCDRSKSISDMTVVQDSTLTANSPEIDTPTALTPGIKTLRLSAEVLFDFDKSNIKNEAKPELEKIYQEIQKNTYSKIEIIGHTDWLGKEPYNQKLSERRSSSVRHYLNKTYKLSLDLLFASGKGELEPIADNRNVQGRKKNRRVEFIIYP